MDTTLQQLLNALVAQSQEIARLQAEIAELRAQLAAQAPPATQPAAG